MHLCNNLMIPYMTLINKSRIVLFEWKENLQDESFRLRIAIDGCLTILYLLHLRIRTPYI